MATARRPRSQCKQGKRGRLDISCAVRKTVHVLPFQPEYLPGVNALRLSVTPPIYYLDMVLFPGGQVTIQPENVACTRRRSRLE